MVLYHATPLDNLGSILVHGLKRGIDGVVYGCEDPKDCLKFAYYHGVLDALVVKFKVDDKNVIETFDHNHKFFGCRCFGATVDIPPEALSDYTKYDLRT